MAYTPTTWVNGATVTPALLNKIETQLVALEGSSSAGVSVEGYGAIGDGTARAVNDTTYGIIGTGKTFATLAAAQASVGSGGTGITDLASSDQLDWAAHQWVVNLLEAAGGGTMVTPRGRYMFNRTLTFPDGWGNQSGSLRGRQVNWEGEGNLTVCKATADFGSGQYMVTGRNRGTNGSGTAQKAYGSWRDIRLIGPTESMTIGTTPCNMDGWGITAERSCYRLTAEYFHSGFDIVGDHGVCENLQAAFNYYGLFLGYSTNLFGDWLMLNCMFERSAYAGIAIHGDSNVSSGFKFIKGGTFTSPYGIIKLAGTGTKALEDSSFDQFMMEDIGNGHVSDAASAAAGAPTAEWMNVEFNMCAFGFNNTYKIAAEGQYATLNMGKATRVSINKIKNPLAFNPGSRAIFDIALFNGFHLEGDVKQMTTNAVASTKPVFFRRSGNQWWNTKFRHYAAGFSAWQGEGVVVETAGAITGEGYALRHSVDRVVMADVAGAASGGFAGIALESSAGASELILMATSGVNVPVALNTSSPTGNFLTLSSTAGQLTTVTDPAVPLVVGWMRANSTNTGRAVFTAMTRGVQPPSDVQLRSGTYSFTSDGLPGTGTLTNGTLRVHQWKVPNAVTLTRIGAEVTTVGDAACTVRLGIYADAGGYPGALMVDAGTIAGDAVAVAEKTISTALAPGLYWIGAVAQGVATTGPTMRCTSTQAFGTNVGAFTSIPGANGSTLGYTISSVTGALPSTFTAGGTSTITIPRTFIKS